MGFFDFFRKKKQNDVIISTSDALRNLRKGDVVEIEGETWEVVGIAEYRYRGSVELEWEIRSARRSGFLSVEEGKIYFWEEIDLKSIEPNLLTYYRRYRHPPEFVTHGGVRYDLKFSGKALYKKGSESYPVEIWEFMDENRNMIDVEIWDEYEIETFKGRELKEWEIEGIFKRK